VVGWATKVYSENTQSALAQSVVRFHVLANSDSIVDQALKMKVKDEVLASLQPELSASRSVEETRMILQSKLQDIETDANAFVQSSGYDYPVTVSLANSFFPTKTYGDVTFFPGEYEALRIVIGEGVGQNWWCVMFPPLCYVDVTKGYATEEGKQQLRDAADEGYVLLSNEIRESNVTVNVRFKVVEFWQNRLHRNRFNNEQEMDGFIVRQLETNERQ